MDEPTLEVPRPALLPSGGAPTQLGSSGAARPGGALQRRQEVPRLHPRRPPRPWGPLRCSLWGRFAGTSRRPAALGPSLAPPHPTSG